MGILNMVSLRNIGDFGSVIGSQTACLMHCVCCGFVGTWTNMIKITLIGSSQLVRDGLF
jgi:hypothetical protein